MAKNIHEAINEVMKNVGYVQKGRAANLNYSFAGEAALIAALRPQMVLSGITMHVSDIQEVVSRDYSTKSGTAMQNVSLTATITFTHAESGTSLSVKSRGEGADVGDKANNKAMTCAFKYALRQTFVIETGDDPDASPSHERKTIAVEEAREMTTPKGATLGSLDREKLLVLVDKSPALADAARIILLTDFNIEA